MGDIAFPCYPVPRSMRRSPAAIAADLAVSPRTAGLRRLIADGQWPGGGTVVIDFSSPNIAKPMHLGLLRSTVIGNSLVRIYQHQGWRAVGINHLSDWGTQFGKLMVACFRWGDHRAR